MINSINNFSNIQVSNVKKQVLLKTFAKAEKNTSKHINFCSAFNNNLIEEELKISDLNNLFKKIEGKEGKDFVDSAYQELVKIMDLEGMAPKEITWEKNEGRQIVGDYLFYNNKIVLYSDYFNKLDKSTQIGIIAHELTHCKQLCNMLRTEGIPLEKIANAYAVSDIRAMLVNNENFIKMYKQAENNGKQKEFISYMTMLGTKKTLKELEEAHSKTLKMAKHPLNSKKGQKAQKDLVAQYNYNGADMEAYNNCPLEKEAMKVENFVINSYKNHRK